MEIDMTAVRARLDHLHESCGSEGWDGYSAYPVTPRALAAADRLLVRLSSEQPFIVPTVEGGIAVSWADEDVQIEFDASGRLRMASCDDVFLTEEED